jgi:CRISPR/Cas system CSM-associated protein Csm3 (group 7 of RAMP superfamily)
MADKTNGRVLWETKDGNRRLMISWQARKGETKIPVPKVEEKIIRLMWEMKVEEANVKFDLVRGNPRNIEFVDEEAAAKAEVEVKKKADMQRQNIEKLTQNSEKEETKTVESPIERNYSKDFHNPYNFVPAIPRVVSNAELGDKKPIGHDRFHAGFYSGKLTIGMTVKTPLLAIDTANVEVDGEHKKYPVRIENDKPFINPTAVKGMLRSAYEAITNSRMSVFQSSNYKCLSYRARERNRYIRKEYPKSPADLLHDSLKPAANLSQLSPADRVFGWVSQECSGAYRGQIRIGAYRGQIRIGSITTETTDAIQNFSDLPLNILGQPKPQQGRFYVAETPNGEAQTEARNNENAGYKQGRGLRGRKVYPHHAHIENDNFWFANSDFEENVDHWCEELTNSKGKKYFREYLRPRKGNRQQRDSQNRSIKGWIKPGTVFKFDIHFTNLSKVELGALVWLLDLPENHFHRLGGGKPYGFGSVRLEITSEEITSGEDLKEFYRSLDSNLKNSVSSADCKTEFAKAANDQILNAFKVACKGFDDGLPIHYPRTSQKPNPEGKNYEWFVANNRQQNGQVVNGYVLPNITDDQGLPILRGQR